MSVSAAQAGVSDIVRRRLTQDTETCRLLADGRACDDVPLFAYGSTVSVRRDGVPWFVGRVTGAPGTGDGRGESAALVLSGPWWYLEQLVYQQAWTLRGGEGSGPSSRVVLGQADDGSRLTSGEIIIQVLQFAREAGAPLQVGVVDPAAYLPLDELRDVTCAEVIRKVLRWHPDCVAWFDHATLPVPTFHCRARAELAAVTLTVGQAPLAAVRAITARADLVAPAVVLYYETGDGDTTDLLVDAAPDGATGREFGALVATIPAGEEAGPTHITLDDLPTRGGGGSGESLAETLYAARSVLGYSGSVVLVEPEAGGPGGVGVGNALNLAGAARTEWAAMRAVVVEDETRVASGTTTVRFGPAEHLAAADLAAALSVTRPGVGGREPGSPAAVRTASSATRVSGAGWGR